jgi:hypothetical protein
VLVSHQDVCLHSVIEIFQLKKPHPPSLFSEKLQKSMFDMQPVGPRDEDPRIARGLRLLCNGRAPPRQIQRALAIFSAARVCFFVSVFCLCVCCSCLRRGVRFLWVAAPPAWAIAQWHEHYVITANLCLFRWPAALTARACLHAVSWLVGVWPLISRERFPSRATPPLPAAPGATSCSVAATSVSCMLSCTRRICINSIFF